MKNLMFVFVFVAMAGSIAVAQTPTVNSPDGRVDEAPAAQQAEIVFVEETINYGTIEQGANGYREFKFKNTGTAPLIITNCKGSCGCTVPTCPKEPLKPGEEGIMKVRYDTKRIGNFTKTITVSSNAKTPSKTVKITGVVKAPTANDEGPAPDKKAQDN